MQQRFALEPIEPTRAPTPEIPHQDKPPEGTPSDPVNIPTPGPDIITPNSDPDNIPVNPGIDIPEFPIPAEVMRALSARASHLQACKSATLFAAHRWQIRSRSPTFH